MLGGRAPRARLVAAALLATLVGLPALAAPAHADRRVAVAPFSALGAEDKSAATRALVHQIEQAIAALPDVTVIPVDQVAAQIRKARRPELQQCDGDPACLAQLGTLVGAQLVVTGEVGGLGESRVVYLGATDVAAGRELRSTTLAIGVADDGGGTTGAVVRLLDPGRYNGSLHLTIDAGGATVYVNGTKVALGKDHTLTLPVGTQAIRVTHPEYRDFVRFVDVAYGKPTELAVNLHQYPIVEHDVKAKPRNLDSIQYVDPPVWRRWYVAGPAILVLAVGAGILTAALVHDFPGADTCKQVGSTGC